MQMWTIKLRVRRDGDVEVITASEGIPPGEIEIRGSDDGNRATLAVRQRDERGRFVASASHTRDRAEEALAEAEEDLGDAEDEAQRSPYFEDVMLPGDGAD